MTHSAGYRAAAVALREHVRAVGIDAEPHAALPGRTWGAVTRPEERERLAALAADFPRVHWDRLLFCAKEAVYKAWFPMTRRRLGFRDASVTFDPAGRTFRAEIVEGTGEEPPAPLAYEGRWAAAPELLLAAVVVPAGPAAVRNRPDCAIPRTS